MTPRRQQTKVPTRQPVRFYKVVAISFLMITIVLLGVIVYMSSKQATIVITTRNSPIEINKTVEVGDKQSDTSIVGISTSTDVIYSMTFSPRGVKEETDIATGVVTLHNEYSQPRTLIATTRLLTPDNVLFRLKEKVTVPPNSTIEAEVYADQAGEEGDIGPIDRFTIPGLNSESRKYVYASSNFPMKGGLSQIGIFSEDDLFRAEQEIKEAVKKHIKSNFEELYGDKEMKYYIDENYLIEVDKEIGSEIDEFEVTINTKVVGVFYEKEDLLKWAESKLESRIIDEAEIIKPSDDDLKIDLIKMEKGDDKVALQITYTGMASLNPDSQEIHKAMFYGKTEEEVRRYLLSLDHIHSVDVTFRPAWIRTIPHISDKVDIIIKSVE